MRVLRGLHRVRRATSTHRSARPARQWLAALALTIVLPACGPSLGPEEAVNYTARTPVGVAGCISPWNLPLYLLTWKIAPALASGCTVVGKPSELTPMTAFLLSGICKEAGLPAGVLNIVHGKGSAAGFSASVTDTRNLPRMLL